MNEEVVHPSASVTYVRNDFGVQVPGWTAGRMREVRCEVQSKRSSVSEKRLDDTEEIYGS
jgi:hypothetical protein